MVWWDIYIATTHKDLGLVMGDIFYRYAEKETALRMLESQELWFSDIKKMNDYGEYDAGFSLVEELISTEYSEHKAVLEKISPDGVGSRFKVLICSFSGEGDCLSMWRGYGDNGRGIAIGYDVGMLKLHSIGLRYLQKMAPISGKPLFLPVIYDKKDFLSNLKIQIDRVIGSKESPSWNDNDKNHRAVRCGMLEILLMRSCILYKSKFFSDERERRGFIEISESTDPYDLNPGKSPFGETEHAKLSINKFGSSIKEIILGPCFFSSEDEIKEELMKNGLGRVIVKKSEGTYRIN